MYETNSYTQIAKDSQVEQMNRPFHGFFFQLFSWAGQAKSVDSAGKSVFRLVKLPILKVIC